MNAEERRQYNKEYYLKNKEKENARCKKYRAEHKCKIKELNKEWRTKNPDYGKEYDAAGYKYHRAEHRKDMGYSKIQRKTQYYIKKLGVRPNTCPICGNETKIEAHHPDYNKWNEIVFCCPSCHQSIHKGNIDCPSVIVLNINI